MNNQVNLVASSTAPSESFSLEALRSGDKSEFSLVVEAFSPRLYRLALKMLSNPQDAEDVLQETFLKAFRAIDRFDGRSSLSTWLYRIATNEALMKLRKKNPEFISIEEPYTEVEDPDQEPLQIVDWCCIPESELMNEEAMAELDRAVENLPASLRLAFLLRDIEHLSTKEAAEVLEVSETALKTRLSRARLRLRQSLSTYFSERMEA